MAATVALPVLTVSPAPAVAGPTGVTLKVVAENGSGCPPKRTNVSLLLGNETIVIDYDPDAFTAYVGGDSAPVDFRKKCGLSLLISTPAQFTFGIREVNYELYAALAQGSSGHLRTNYEFSEMPTRTPHTFDIRGPFSHRWEISDVEETGSVAYKPCGEDRLLAINTEIRVIRGTSDPMEVSYLSMTTVDARTWYRLAWKTCP
ncbi:DUF4360 domain-containing protein [Actinomadura macra]|uniref:DUF4360 domain-containing protein n=1 Tax=Actinomadura macra TaxID=46164 RepID=UPI001470EF5D|nr:DUF4360 domain-containing protein [Actinomadura macra]